MYSAYLTFGRFGEPSETRGNLDTTIGSGEGGFGGEDFLRFQSENKRLRGGLISLPIRNLEMRSLPEFPPLKAKTAQWELEGEFLSVPICRKAYFDVQSGVVMCTTETTEPDFGLLEYLPISNDISLVSRESRYAGYVVTDPLAMIPNSKTSTRASDYRVLSAFFWPHNDDVFENVFDDDDEALVHYFRGLESALQRYFLSATPQANLFRSALADV